VQDSALAQLQNRAKVNQQKNRGQTPDFPKRWSDPVLRSITKLRRARDTMLASALVTRRK
jgi:hypothetical protein